MQRKFYILLTLILAIFSVHAQVSGSKLDMHLLNRLKQGKIYDGTISLLVKGDLEKIKALTLKMGGTYKYGHGDIASVSIPPQNLIAFSNNMAIKKIQSTMAKGMALMDTARIRNNIDSVIAGYAPLQDSITGKNVIVGIIDGGIYWQHKDFKNPDGTTRILYIWDQPSNTHTAPLPYNYGSEWTFDDINHGNCSEVEPYGQTTGCPSDFGHGTCVAGITSGNGSSFANDSNLRGVYTGVAPQSNLIVVNIGTGGTCLPSGVDFMTQISDAVDYIFKKADALGMPCVINISQGTYYGSHDGIDLTSELIDNLLDERNGRCVVAAAGNGGNVPHHLSYSIPADSANAAYTLFKYNTSNHFVYFDLWADTANFNNAWFTIGGYDSLGNKLGQLDYMNVPTNFNPLIPNSTFAISRPVYNGTVNMGLVNVGVTLDSARYHIEFEIDNPTNVRSLWGLQTYGSGTFDLWATSTLIGTSDMLFNIIPTPGDTIVFPAPNYKYPDYNKTIVSSWQCSDKVITVGNYSNRAGYIDVDTVYVDLTLAGNGGEVVGKRFITSSLGPTRDNRVKPDVIATGSTILCTGDSNNIAVTIHAGNGYKVGWGGKDLRNGGTSMAAPVVAGIAALYLQKRPNASYDEIKRALICTATTDSFTGVTPNAEYGYGKVNAFRALTAAYCITYGAVDTACMNYNPLANTDTGGCVAKVYGCTDSAASNFNPLANIENGGCIYTAIANISNTQILMQAMPNPFSSQVTFSIFNNGYNFKTGSIELTNEIGEKVAGIAVSPNNSTYILNTANLAAGVYFYLLKLDNKVVKTGKLVAE